MEAVIELAFSNKIEVQSHARHLKDTSTGNYISLKAKLRFLITTIEESAVLIISYLRPAYLGKKTSRLIKDPFKKQNAEVCT